MNNRGLGIFGIVVVVLLAVWLLGGTSVTCRDSFWDKDKKVIEIKQH